MQILCDRTAENELRKAILLLGSMLSENFFYQKDMPNSVEKTWRIHPKCGPKSTKNASGSTRKPPRAPTKQPTHFYCNCLSLPGLCGTSVFTHVGSNIVEKCLQKISQKTDGPKTYLFFVFVFPFCKNNEKNAHVGSPKQVPAESFFGVFVKTRKCDKGMLFTYFR